MINIPALSFALCCSVISIGRMVSIIEAGEGKIKPIPETSYPSAFWDVFPTIALITGIEAPEKVDGISFLPTLLGEKGQNRMSTLIWSSLN
ncbi:MAG: hypothetical protein IH594_10900 [Bacteroidales bacterium]|nr:hypothetical protein [Bacteroidales bacterium]